ncbi:MAG: four helix bundle protein [Prevotella sp.]|nr:four helix bundle protein [Prevotella sp.]MBQ7426610.1 four helix bundle protein [Prevotella sp.]MBR0265327.1 four helix bundle protein [Prevotella sp.]
MQDFFYRKLKVYQDAMVLLEDVYQLTKKFPSTELHGLSNQIQRAAVSIPSNIAEGMGRFSIKDRIRFIDISNGSLMEVMCQLEIAHRLGYISDEELQIQDTKIATIAKMVLGLRKNLEEKINNNTVMSE